MRRYRWLTLVSLLLPVVAVAVPAQTASAATPFSIKTTPALLPSFTPTTYDYAVRCTQSKTSTTVMAVTGSGWAKIGGKSYELPATVKLELVADQSVTVSNASHSYTIRCLPADFTRYQATVEGKPQAFGYLVTLGDYVVSFDNHGVPVWWYEDTSPIYNATFYGPGQIGWWTGAQYGGYTNGVYTIRNLDGTVKAVVSNPDTSLGLNIHDFQILPNGDYLSMEVTTTATTDLSSWGLSSSAPVWDPVLVEINPAGQIVWSWDALGHIDVAAENVNWRNEYPDVFHMNAWQEYGNQIIVSFRHLDAVFDINKTTGNIIWKLGGTPTAQSLTVVGNTYPQVFSGQHDARRLSDGSITVFDDASLESGVAAAPCASVSTPPPTRRPSSRT